MTGANAVRGEVTADLCGQPVRLCLTFGALAEMESLLALSGLEAIGRALPDLSREALLAVVHALMQNRGQAVQPQGLVTSDRDQLAGAVARCLLEALK